MPLIKVGQTYRVRPGPWATVGQVVRIASSIDGAHAVTCVVVGEGAGRVHQIPVGALAPHGECLTDAEIWSTLTVPGLPLASRAVDDAFRAMIDAMLTLPRSPERDEMATALSIARDAAARAR